MLCKTPFLRKLLVLIAALLSVSVPVAFAQQTSWAPTTAYYNAATYGYGGKYNVLYTSPTAAIRSSETVAEQTCPLTGPGSIFSFAYVQQSSPGGYPYFDSFWYGYYNHISCQGGFNLALHAEAGTFVICNPGGSWHHILAMPDPQGVCTAIPNYQDPPKEPGPPPPPCPTCVGNPINAANGNKFEQRTEYAGSGPFPLVFGWTYNRLTDGAPIIAGVNDEVLGVSRRHSYMRVVQLSSTPAITSATVLRPDGKTYRFALSGSNTWVGDWDISDRLIRQVDGSNAITGWQYILKADDTTENYDANGRLKSIVNRAGLSQTMVYNPGGQLTSVIDDFGHQLTFTYDAATGNISSMIDPANGVTLFAYDTSGNLSIVTYPDSHTRTYLYNEVAYTGSSGFPTALTGILDENQVRFATFQYSGDQAISSEHAGGVEKYTVSYGNPRTITDPLGTSRTMAVTPILGVRRPTGITQPCSGTGCSGTRSSSFTYDGNGNISQRTDFNGNLTCNAYDLSRNLENSRTEGLSGSGTCISQVTTPATRTITTTWHPNFRLPATITEPAAGGGSKITTNTYDTAGNLLSRSIVTPAETRLWSWTYDAFGRVLTATDPHNHTSTNTYYPNIAAQGLNRGMLASVANALNQTVTIDSYNVHGQPLQSTDANGLVTTLTYDTRQRLKTRNIGGETTLYDYDNVGQLHQVTMPDSSTLTYTYDNAHRLVQIQDGLSNKVVYTLDNMGNRTREDAIDPQGQLARTRSRVYDPLNRLQKDIGGANPAAEISQYEYDDNGNQAKMTDPLSHTTANTYDALNRLKQVTDPGSGVTLYQYDTQDNLNQVTDPKGLNTAYGYNGFNEMLSQSSPDTGGTSFAYYAGGNQHTKTDARSITATYGYDALDRVVTIVYPDESVTYGYDTCANGKGRLCSITDKSGSTNYSYDLHGRVLAKTQTVAGVSQTVGYTYNAAGQMDTMTFPSGSVVHYTFLNNRITGVSVDGNTVVANADYEPFGPIGEWSWGNDSVANPNKHTRYFDLSGRNTKIESGSALDPQIIVYDAASRITALQKLTSNAVDPAKSASFGYDNLDRLTALSPGAGNAIAAQSYSYDVIGNRLSNTIAGSVTNYSYGATSHRLNGLSGGISKTFGYDPAGNKTTDGVQTWSYGGNNRPTQVSLVTGGGTTNILSDINALGQRVRKTVPIPGGPPDITWFVYDEAGRLIGEYRADGSVVHEHLWLNDLPVGVGQ